MKYINLIALLVLGCSAPFTANSIMDSTPNPITNGGMGGVSDSSIIKTPMITMNAKDSGIENSAGQGGADTIGNSFAGEAGVNNSIGMAGMGGSIDNCELGVNSTTNELSGVNVPFESSYFPDGVFPPGQYRITYVGGCMKYSADQNWMVQSNNGSSGWWLVNTISSTSSMYLQLLPSENNTDGYSSFDDCVSANLLSKPYEFTFYGGSLGVWLQDSNYTDNISGNNNPQWKITLLDSCPN